MKIKYIIVLLLIGCTSIVIDTNELNGNKKCNLKNIEIPDTLNVPIYEIENSKSYKEKYDILLTYTLLIKKQNDKLKKDIRENNDLLKTNCQ